MVTPSIVNLNAAPSGISTAFVFYSLRLFSCFLFTSFISPSHSLDLVVYTFTSTASPTVSLQQSFEVLDLVICFSAPKAVLSKILPNRHNAYQHYPLCHLLGLWVSGPILRWRKWLLIRYVHGTVQLSSERGRKRDIVCLAHAHKSGHSLGPSRASLELERQQSQILS